MIRFFRRLIFSLAAFILMMNATSFAIVVNPTQEQVQAAIAKGKAAVLSKTPPSQLYWRFGSPETLHAHGFLMTKLGGLAVLAAHYAFRAESPTEQDIVRITKESALQVSVSVFGSSPEFGKDSYMVLNQGDRLIKPTQVRFDAQARRSDVWPNDPPYQAKVVASFPYEHFDPVQPTTISVFPGEGGEVQFDLDFSRIP
ncbi:MAG: hypothetical protein NPIRA02_23320 [Nitrospirales bacterium]|nr:MAG: hypothetical protein NPIRA02_23320 [Nitrospirales bacterium]